MDIITYLNNNNIIVDENIARKSDRNIIDISKQIDLIVMIQSRLMNNGVTIIPRINSTIGKDIESFRVQNKKVEKILNMIRVNDNKTSLDWYILEEGNVALDRAKKSFNAIDNEIYFEIIRRSMSNYEMCLGRVDEGNLKLEENEVLKIRTTKYISYNLIEHDLFKYIKRLNRRGFNIQTEKVIDEFIYKSSLSEKSKNYLISLCNYPYETMKLIYKYRYYEDNDYDDWMKDIKMAIEIDGDEII